MAFSMFMFLMLHSFNTTDIDQGGLVDSFRRVGVLPPLATLPCTDNGRHYPSPTPGDTTRHRHQATRPSRDHEPDTTLARQWATRYISRETTSATQPTRRRATQTCVDTRATPPSRGDATSHCEAPGRHHLHTLNFSCPAVCESRLETVESCLFRAESRFRECVSPFAKQGSGSANRVLRSCFALQNARDTVSQN